MDDASVVDGFLTDKPPHWADTTRELHRLIKAAGPALTARVSYKMLMYHLGTDKARWVVAVDVREKVVTVRFLWGVLLDDPRGILRGGTSTLMNVDLPSPEALDPAAITDLVTQAVARYPDYVAGSAGAR
jgi:hypothetical protein